FAFRFSFGLQFRLAWQSVHDFFSNLVKRVALKRIQATRFKSLVLCMSLSQNRVHFWATCISRVDVQVMPACERRLGLTSISTHLCVS
ncbi:hypothetical protein ACWGS9_13835, partial [Bradyrhizobium sp. Arg314]